jgi:hypothetical protein
MLSFLISLAVLIGILALVYWVLTQFPIPPIFIKIWLVVAVVVLVLFILSAFGLLHGLGDMPRVNLGALYDLRLRQ